MHSIHASYISTDRVVKLDYLPCGDHCWSLFRDTVTAFQYTKATQTCECFDSYPSLDFEQHPVYSTCVLCST